MSSKNQTTIKAEPGKQELFITREFDAPRDFVFKAHTNADLYAQWLGPNGYSTRFDEFNPEPGGKYRFVNIDQKGNEYAFHGVYHEVLAPERIISTFEFDGLPEKGHVMMETVIFESLPNGRSRIRSQSLFQSVSDRDGMIQSGMETGVKEGYERLDEMIKGLQTAH